MAHVIVVHTPTRVKVYRPGIGVSLDRARQDLEREGFILPTTLWFIIDDSDLPPTRARRHAWRVQNGRVIVDPTIPDPVDRLADLRSSTTLAELKTALARILG